MNATIRRLKVEDAASFKAIRLEALRANPELLRSTFEIEAKLDVAWFAGRLQSAYIVGAFQNDELVGTAGFAVQDGPPNAHKGRLFGMYVSPSSRNLGFGRLLLNAALEVARESVELVQLGVVSDNRPACSLYESAGFLPYGVEERASKYGEKYFDETLMILDFRR
ncbi:ribosomal protein S18 acetylase RimI-like enzyme [Bradyrhizobium sp. GM2.2]|uniref:GNAT family N-acetyltransferase n=1 Tax=Bradyrhizobium sp. GM2.2 TaxID=3156358 RepID=UPI0033984F9C